jgi:hypothetical protein
MISREEQRLLFCRLPYLLVKGTMTESVLLDCVCNQISGICPPPWEVSGSTDQRRTRIDFEAYPYSTSPCGNAYRRIANLVGHRWIFLSHQLVVYHRIVQDTFDASKNSKARHSM